MSQLEMVMATVIEAFAQFTGTNGNKRGLSEGELKARLEKELRGFLQSGRDKEAADKLLKDLEENGDATVDINEFTLSVAAIPSSCHVYLEQEALNGCPIHPDS